MNRTTVPLPCVVNLLETLDFIHWLLAAAGVVLLNNIPETDYPASRGRGSARRVETQPNREAFCLISYRIMAYALHRTTLRLRIGLLFLRFVGTIRKLYNWNANIPTAPWDSDYRQTELFLKSVLTNFSLYNFVDSCIQPPISTAQIFTSVHCPPERWTQPGMVGVGPRQTTTQEHYTNNGFFFKYLGNEMVCCSIHFVGERKPSSICPGNATPETLNQAEWYAARLVTSSHC